MDDSPAGLPEDIDALRAVLVAGRAEVAIVRAQQSDDQAVIAHLKLQIEKLNRDRYGPRSERTARLLDQLTGSQLAEDSALYGSWPIRRNRSSSSGATQASNR